jgi:hypothetical protein
MPRSDSWDTCVERYARWSVLTEGTSPTSSADLFSYLPTLEVKSVFPRKGLVAGGTTVKIRGVNLGGATAVSFGSVSATSFHVNSPTSITAVAPAESAGTVDVTVTTPEGTSPLSRKDRFKFVPTVTGVSPNSGSTAGGTSVTVSGSGFALGATATRIKFGSRFSKSVDCTSSTTCTAVAPANEAGTVDVKANVNKVGSPKNPSADQFTYE